MADPTPVVVYSDELDDQERNFYSHAMPAFFAAPWPTWMYRPRRVVCYSCYVEYDDSWPISVYKWDDPEPLLKNPRFAELEPYAELAREHDLVLMVHDSGSVLELQFYSRYGYLENIIVRTYEDGPIFLRFDRTTHDNHKSMLSALRKLIPMAPAYRLQQRARAVKHALDDLLAAYGLTPPADPLAAVNLLTASLLLEPDGAAAQVLAADFLAKNNG